MVQALEPKRLHPYALVGIATISFVIISYAMFGDPWGGWSFGPRYLIPASALTCAFIGYAIQRYGRKIIFGLIFLALLIPSVYLSYLGALTTNAIPPKQEAEHLVTPIPYTPKYNRQFVKKNLSSSLVYNLFLTSFISVNQLHLFLVATSVFVLASLYFQSLHVQKIKRH